MLSRFKECWKYWEANFKSADDNKKSIARLLILGGYFLGILSSIFVNTPFDYVIKSNWFISVNAVVAIILVIWAVLWRPFARHVESETKIHLLSSSIDKHRGTDENSLHIEVTAADNYLNDYSDWHPCRFSISNKSFKTTLVNAEVIIEEFSSDLNAPGIKFPITLKMPEPDLILNAGSMCEITLFYLQILPPIGPLPFYVRDEWMPPRITAYLNSQTHSDIFAEFYYDTNYFLKVRITGRDVPKTDCIFTVRFSSGKRGPILSITDTFQ